MYSKTIINYSDGHFFFLNFEQNKINKVLKRFT